MKFIQSFLLSAVAILLASVPAFAATLDLTVSENGSDSDNAVVVGQSNTTVVSQTNSVSIKNDINATASTGGNTVEGSTGGEVVVDTGNASTEVKVTNEAGSNVAEVDPCGGCGETAIMADIKNNGAGTDNDIKVGSLDATLLVQDNVVKFDTDVDAMSSTGKNQVEGTTGSDVMVVTGNAEVDVAVDNLAGSNHGVISGSGESGSGLTAAIQMNGADSQNKIEASIDQSVALMQENKTSIRNYLDGYGKTGKNSVTGTTGGSVIIATGDAKVDIGVTNQAGFNHAALDCGCLAIEASATIKKNGTDSKNEIKAKLQANQMVSQVNTCGTAKPSRFSWLFKSSKGYSQDCFNNNLDGLAKTGYNHINGSTAGGESDPAILTGLSDVVITAENVAGSNTF